MTVSSDIYSNVASIDLVTKRRSVRLGNNRRRSSRRNHVSFGMVEVRSYYQTMGEHPCTSVGPSVELDWRHYNEVSFKLSMFEWMREKNRVHDMSQLILSLEERERICYMRGFTEEDILQAEFSNYEIQQERLSSRYEEQLDNKKELKRIEEGMVQLIV